GPSTAARGPVAGVMPFAVAMTGNAGVILTAADSNADGTCREKATLGGRWRRSSGTKRGATAPSGPLAYNKFLCEPKLCNAEHLTVGHVRLDPGQGHLRHNHPGSEEILFIFAGEGEQMVEDDLEENGGKPEFFKVKSGDLIHIPASVYHQ